MHTHPPEKRDDGFTLIELLVVVVVIAILAAIAIPTFLNQRTKAWEKAVLSDLRNAALVAESDFDGSLVYPADTAELLAADMNFTEGVTLDDTDSRGTSTEYCYTMEHANLPGRQYYLDSTVGTAQKVTATLRC